MIELILPWPPSTNTYWRHPSRGPLAGRHLISAKGRAYRQEILACTLNSKPDKSLSGRLAIQIIAFPPDHRKRDLDNVLKSLLDALTHSKVIEDDGLIDRLVIEREAVSPPGRISVTIKEL